MGLVKSKTTGGWPDSAEDSSQAGGGMESRRSVRVGRRLPTHSPGSICKTVGYSPENRTPTMRKFSETVAVTTRRTSRRGGMLKKLMGRLSHKINRRADTIQPRLERSSHYVQTTVGVSVSSSTSCANGANPALTSSRTRANCVHPSVTLIPVRSSLAASSMEALQGSDVTNYSVKQSTNISCSHKSKQVRCELMGGLIEFLRRRCTHLHVADPCNVPGWLGAVDRQLIRRGLRTAEFLSASSLVFLYMLLRRNVSSDIDTVHGLRIALLTCLYVTYSYIGSEISYPLTPFYEVAGFSNCEFSSLTVRRAFWSLCLGIAQSSSADMLSINQRPSLLAGLLHELVSYSAAAVSSPPCHGHVHGPCHLSSSSLPAAASHPPLPVQRQTANRIHVVAQ